MSHIDPRRMMIICHATNSAPSGFLRYHSPNVPSNVRSCFVYQKQYGGFLLSQSGEAKCNLYTAQEGHTTLNLRKCEYHVHKTAPYT
jgi:hypothetical protein